MIRESIGLVVRIEAAKLIRLSDDFSFSTSASSGGSFGGFKSGDLSAVLILRNQIFAPRFPSGKPEAVGLHRPLRHPCATHLIGLGDASGESLHGDGPSRYHGGG